MPKRDTIRIGSRGSNLALIQTSMVKNLLQAANPDLQIEIITIKTTGDTILEKNLSEIGGKGLFIKEIEEQLIADTIDFAVHSYKDIPALTHPDLTIPYILERQDPRDAFICHTTNKITDLPQKAIIGTSSPRRASQVLNIRPDLQIVPFRGNIQTRLQKLADHQVDATFLAQAGLIRSQITDKSITPLDPNIMLPAIAQGAICIELKKANQDNLHNLLSPLNHQQTNICTSTERAFQHTYEGSCTSPIAALATIDNQQIQLDCLIASLDGKTIHRTHRTAPISDAQTLGIEAAKELQCQT